MRAKELIEQVLNGQDPDSVLESKNQAYSDSVVQSAFKDPKVYPHAKSLVSYRKKDSKYAMFRTKMYTLLTAIANDYLKFGKLKSAKVKKEFDYYTSTLDWYTQELKDWKAAFEKALKEYSAKSDSE